MLDPALRTVVPEVTPGNQGWRSATSIFHGLGKKSEVREAVKGVFQELEQHWTGLSDKGILDRSGVTFLMFSRTSPPARPIPLLSFVQNTCHPIKFITITVPHIALHRLALPNLFYI